MNLYECAYGQGSQAVFTFAKPVGKNSYRD